MTRRLLHGLAAVLAAVVCGTAQAEIDNQLPQQQWNFPITPGQQNIVFPKFDTIGGTRQLKRVTIGYSGNVRGNAQVENLSPTLTTTVTFNITGTFNFTGADGRITDSTNFAGQGTSPLLQQATPPDNAGPDFHNFGEVVTGAFNDSFVFTAQADLTYFTGPGNFSVLPAVPVGTVQFNASPLVDLRQQVTGLRSTGNVTVLYEFALVTGSCCLPGGTCVVTDQADCTTRGGTYNGNNTTCATAVCPRACCLPSGQCVTVTPAQCTQQNGTLQNVGVTCATANCPQPGACCVPVAGASSCQVLQPAACTALNGIFQGAGTSCTGVQCPGACCLPSGSCVFVTQASCTQQNGTFNGAGVTCGTVTCPQPGACCIPAPGSPACQVVLPSVCTALNGTFLGAGSSCANAPCPGACCLPGGSCVFVTQSSCTSQSGTFSGAGVPCSAANCPRACCLPDETCQVLTATQCASAQGTWQALGVTCANANCQVGVCDCYWENGEADDGNAIASERNTSVPESTAADDFIIPVAKVLIGREFCGCMVTNDLERVQGNIVDRPEAVLALYEDCNGKPGALITEFNDETYEILGNAPFGSPGQYKYVKFCFDLEGFRLESINGERRVWVSLIGVGDGLLGPGERYFWATSKTVAEDGPSDEIQGVQAQLKSTWIEGFEDWRDVEDTNGQCHDLCFDYCGDLCDVVCNNTPFALDCGAKMLNTTFFGTKAADNFQIQPCASVDVCLIQAWIATNCTPSRSILEVRGNECDTPTSPAIRVVQNPTVVPALNVQGNPIFFNSPVSGIPLQVYCLEWEFEPGAFSLTGGENYWISVFLNGTGVITEEAYFLCKQRTACNLKITEAQYISAPFDVNEWEPISLIIGTPSDLAFRILGNIRLENDELVAPSSGGLADPGVPGPQRDLNGDGAVDVKDIEQMLRLMSVGSAN